MLEIKNYSLSFNQKVIFNDTQFKAHNNQFIVIIGESGTGKTTLLNSLFLNNHFSGKYTYNNKTMNKIIIQKYFYKVEQFPEILEDLTVENHFKLIDEDFVSKDSYDCLEQLNIKELLHKYPSQLSGGELKRVALALAFIINKPILIVDEPTASLNEEYSIIISQLLKKYSETGHIVIASSHDAIILDYADGVYEIEYNKLNYKEINDNVKSEKQEIDDTYINMKLTLKNHLEMYLHSLRRSKIIKIIMIILISVSSIGLVFNNTAIATLKELVNDISSTEILVYKDPSGQGIFEYSERGTENPLTDEELQQINNIEHISSVNYRYDCEINDYVNEDSTVNLEVDNVPIMNKIQAKENNKALQFDIPEDINETAIYLKTFNNNIDYSNKIENQLTYEQGVYISQTLFNILFKNSKSKENLSLYFPIQIPLYNCSGMSWGWK
jgi:putative ABC transport system ATP-binding protein